MSYKREWYENFKFTNVRRLIQSSLEMIGSWWDARTLDVWYEVMLTATDAHVTKIVMKPSKCLRITYCYHTLELKYTFYRDDSCLKLVQRLIKFKIVDIKCRVHINRAM